MALQSGTRLLGSRIECGATVHFLMIDPWNGALESFTANRAPGWKSSWPASRKDDWKIVVGTGLYAFGLITDGWKWYDNPETINKLSPLV